VSDISESAVQSDGYLLVGFSGEPIGVYEWGDRSRGGVYGDVSAGGGGYQAADEGGEVLVQAAVGELVEEGEVELAYVTVCVDELF